MSEVILVKNRGDSTINFTEAAQKHIEAYLNKNQGLGIRLAVKKTGCSGYSYVIDYVKEKINTTDLEFPLFTNYKLFVDQKSYPLLINVTVDYVKQGINHKFVFINPQQKGQCGCGESFTIEE